MFGQHVIYRAHAVQRMFERGIVHGDVLEVLRAGDVIESYPEDVPYPSRLMLGFVNSSPLHVVAAYNATVDETIVITVYRPDQARWMPDFRIRRRP